MPEQVITIATLAAEAYACFETATRPPRGLTRETAERAASALRTFHATNTNAIAEELLRAPADEPGETFSRVRDGSPEWLSALTWQAHDNGEFLPDDWRYSTIVAALGFLSDDDGTPSDEQGHEFVDGHVDAYNGARLAWLASHGLRAGYVDQAREDGLVGENADLLEQIGAGQYAESLEVFEQVRGFLQERLDELEDDTDDEEGV